MIFDCFTFIDDIELLEIRLTTHEPHVDYFVIIESNIRPDGTKKPYYLDELFKTSPFDQYVDKVKILKLKTVDRGSIENNKNYEYDSIYDAVYDAADDDIIILGDMNNILKQEAFESLTEFERPGFFSLASCYLFFNYQIPDPTTSSVFFKRKIINKQAPSSIIDKEVCCDMGQLLYSGWNLSRVPHELFGYTDYTATIYEGPDIVTTNRYLSHFRAIAPGLGSLSNDAFKHTDSILEDLSSQALSCIEIGHSSSKLKQYFSNKSFIFVPDLTGINRYVDLLFMNDTLDNIDRYRYFVRGGGVICGTKYNDVLNDFFTKCNRFGEFWFALL